MNYLTYSECLAIVNSKPANKDIVNWFSKQANIILKIKDDLDELKKEEKILRSQYKVHLEKIASRRREIRERCQHLIVDAYAEEAGVGMSKYGRCYICGDIAVEV